MILRLTINFVDLIGAFDPMSLLFDADIDIADFGSWSDVRYVNITSKLDTPRILQEGYVIASFDPVWPLPSNFWPLGDEDDGWVEVWIWMSSFQEFPTA